MLSIKSTFSTDRILILISCIAVTILSYLLLFFQPRLVSTDGPVIGRITSGGVIRRRHSGSLSWQNLRGDNPVFRNDIVYVPKDVQSFIVFGNQKRLELFPDSMIQLDEVSKDSIEITLIEGEVKKNADVMVKKQEVQKLITRPMKGAKLLVYLMDLNSLELRYTELDQRFKHLLYGVPSREKISGESLKFYLALDQLIHFDLRTIRPEPDATVGQKASPWIELLWTPIPFDNVRYEVQISKEENFNRVIAYETKKNRLSIQLGDPSAYFWRVRAKRGKEALLSETTRFVISADVGELNPAFRRLPTHVPGGYTLEVSSDSEFSVIVSSQVAEKPKCSMKGLDRGSYFCRIHSVGDPKLVKVYRFVVK